METLLNTSDGAEWVDLAQDRYRCQDLVNKVTKLWIP
jgi:hypothetical protein